VAVINEDLEFRLREEVEDRCEIRIHRSNTSLLSLTDEAGNFVDYFSSVNGDRCLHCSC